MVVIMYYPSAISAFVIAVHKNMNGRHDCNDFERHGDNIIYCYSRRQTIHE